MTSRFPYLPTSIASQPLKCGPKSKLVHTPLVYREYPPAMANTLRAPDAEKPIDYKRTALTWAVIATVWFLVDVRDQKREIRDAARENDQRILHEIFSEPVRCVSSHCVEGDHVYPEVP